MGKGERNSGVDIWEENDPIPFRTLGYPPHRTQSPEEQQHRLGKCLEVVVPIDLVVISHGNLPKHLDKEVIKRKKSDFCHCYSLELNRFPKVHTVRRLVSEVGTVER